MTAITPPLDPRFRSGPPAPQGPRLPSPAMPPPPRPTARVVLRQRMGKLGLAAIAIGLAGIGLAIDREGLAAVIALFVLVVPFEKLFPRHRQRIRRPQVLTDIGYGLANPILAGAGLAVAAVFGVLSLAWLPGLAFRPLVAMIPPVALPLVAAVLFDFVIYWTHRWYHEVPALWKFHSVHHSPEHMDWISGFRSHPLDGTLLAPAFIFLLAAGFDAELTGVITAVQIVLGIFLHANVRWRLRPLQKVVMTPEFHHWHHANEPGAVNSNYAAFLPVWDLIFGTYFMPRNRRPMVYGVTEPIPSGMAAQLWYPMRGLGNPLNLVLHPVRSIRVGYRVTRGLVRDMYRSARRPRRRSHDDVAPSSIRPSSQRPPSTAVMPHHLLPDADLRDAGLRDADLRDSVLRDPSQAPTSVWTDPNDYPTVVWDGNPVD